MQDYDHWDALVIGEWPPGRSGPQVGVTLLPFSILYRGTFFLVSFSLFMSCVAVGLVPLFITKRGTFSTICVDTRMPLQVARPLISFLASFLVAVCRSHIYMCMYICIVYIDLGFVLYFFPVTGLHALILVKKDVQAMTGYDSPDHLVQPWWMRRDSSKVGSSSPLWRSSDAQVSSHAEYMCPCNHLVFTLSSPPRGLTRTMHCMYPRV